MTTKPPRAVDRRDPHAVRRLLVGATPQEKVVYSRIAHRYWVGEAVRLRVLGGKGVADTVNTGEPSGFSYAVKLEADCWRIAGNYRNSYERACKRLGRKPKPWKHVNGR